MSSLFELIKSESGQGRLKPKFLGFTDRIPETAMRPTPMRCRLVAKFGLQHSGLVLPVSIAVEEDKKKAIRLGSS